MPGIVGVFGNGDKSLLDRMSNEIKHENWYKVDKFIEDEFAIARVHLGILNLEPQPIYNENKSLCIFMDGEIFDYEKDREELKKKGHKFHVNNDPEFCLHLYEEKGEKAFKELNGSFCIAIYDLNAHELLLVNDRFSSRPLFYCLANNGTLLFSTQLSSIIQSSEVPRELNIKAIFEFFTFQKVLGTETFYKNINLLPSATILYYRKGNISFTHYWKMKYNDSKHSEKYYVDKLAEAIKKSVARRTQGDHRFGLLLSGGLDSRTILAATDKKMVCFTIGDSENRQVKIAERIAKAKGCKHIFLKRDSDHYVNLVDRGVEIGDGMYCFTHAHNIGFFDQIHTECDILLHGFGFDSLLKELFYIPSIKLFGKRTPFHRHLSKISTPLQTVFLNETLYKNRVDKLFVEPYSTEYKNLIVKSINEVLLSAEESGARDPYKKADYLTAIHSAFNILAYLHVSHIRSYIDERTVTFDNDLLNLHLEIPMKLRKDNRIFKKVMKKIDSHIASITNANTGCSPTAPKLIEWGFIAVQYIVNKLLHRPLHAHSSWPDYAKLIRENAKLKNIIGETIHDEKCLDPSIFNIQKIEEMFNKHLTNKEDYAEFLLLLLTFGRWYKRYGPY
jgi:asparagine synthase (glutamine-hydrolysing)